jgi:hypothetical protein
MALMALIYLTERNIKPRFKACLEQPLLRLTYPLTEYKVN